jgi:hypothetical protein
MSAPYKTAARTAHLGPTLLNPRDALVVHGVPFLDATTAQSRDAVQMVCVFVEEVLGSGKPVMALRADFLRLVAVLVISLVFHVSLTG